MRSTLLAVAALALLAACSSSTQSLEELRYSTPHTDPYQAALAGGYQKLAEEQVAAYNWEDSERFADKGLAANLGRDIAPEEIAAWDIPAELQPALASARTKLLDIVAANKTTQPNQTAAAMLLYDRWVLTASHAVPPEKIKAAQDAFEASLATMQQAQAPEPGTEAPTTEPAKNKEAITVLYFPFDSASLGKSAASAISGVVEKLKAATSTSAITINGHTDRAGTEEYNLNLSERRAHYVQKALGKAGIPDTRMHSFGFGESDPAVPTEDGVKEPKNRRVEIFVE